jgi:hypothetical protein
MKHAETNKESNYLEAERQRLLDCIVAIRKSGTVAHAYCWLIESTESKGSRTYTYIKLLTQKPDEKLTSKSLGRPGSDRHREWKAAIERREAIAELEQQLKMLNALIERQAKSAYADLVSISLALQSLPQRE